jgi:2-C-methyl-D-erythritol 2,4-cyclodiphosphate synthase
MRIGIGLDVHRFAPGRRLILGGVEIPYERGLEGYSDADALTHAICDALLGAAGLGDIGLHFPAGDTQFKDISSLELLRRVREMLEQRGFAIVNVDAVIVAEEPRVASYFPQMRGTLAEALQIPPERVNLKATRPEGLGALGRVEGVLAQAVALLEEDERDS